MTETPIGIQLLGDLGISVGAIILMDRVLKFMVAAVMMVGLAISEKI